MPSSRKVHKPMLLSEITDWLDRTLKVREFDDVSNNGVQVGRTGTKIDGVAFAVDASVAAVRTAAEVGAQLLVVHHGISWGGGIRRIDGGIYKVVKAAMDADIAIYACHLPLDANEKYGNNWELARYIGLHDIRKAFSYHGNVIGVIGKCKRSRKVRIGRDTYDIPAGTIGVCSGGAGEFAEDAKNMGCDLYLTGEASWGDMIAAQNVGMHMVCAGHYDTEVFGVRAVSQAMRKAFKLKTMDITEVLR